MRKNSVTALFLALFSLFVPMWAFLLWNHRMLPPANSLHGRGIDHMINYLLLSVEVLLVIGHIVFSWFILKYYSRDRATFRLASRKVEWQWAVGPIIAMSLIAEGGVLSIGLPVWKQLHVEGNPADTVTIEVQAQQFAWIFHYPGKDGVFGHVDSKCYTDSNTAGVDPKDKAGKDDIIEDGTLRVPVDRLIHLKLRAKDVIHSFYLPYQRVKQDTVPGMVIDTWFTPTETGKFEILCSQLCGLGHYKMRGVLQVLSQADYDKYLKEAAEDL